MNLWFSSYEKNIYKLKINKRCTRLKEIKEKKLLVIHHIYICKYGNKIAVALKKNDEGKTAVIIILNNKIENVFEFYNEVSYTHVHIIHPLIKCVHISILTPLNDITKKWATPYSNWDQTLSQFRISFEYRIQLEI